MDIDARKYKIIEKVMHLNEPEIRKIEAFLIDEFELSSSLDRALEQVKNGEVTPHEEVQKKYKKWL